MIRRARPVDADKLVAMGQRFISETEYRDHIAVRPDKLMDALLTIVTSPDGVVFVSGPEADATGMIAMVVHEHPFSGERIATEVAWWVEPEARGDGLRLLRASENWARERGAAKMQMVAPNERVCALYKRLGYVPIETSFQRSL